MEKTTNEGVWIFHGMGGQFASGVFTSLEQAEHWIQQHGLTGLLTYYPLNTGVYDWALEHQFFQVKQERQTKAEFIQQFTSASQEHYHYEHGERD